MQNVRKQYASLIEQLLSMGEREHAHECARTAVRCGVWNDPLQRPTDFEPGLPAEPLYDPARFWFVSYLEEQYSVIRDELLSVDNPARAGFSPVDEPLVAAGRWDEIVFYEAGVRMEVPCARFPKTAAIVSSIPEAIQSGGVVMVSWLAPGTHIVPHCGASNRKLRVHMGLRVPDGALLRVGDRQLTWTEGRCLVFDDSFEHEVWNRAAEPRVVLLFDVVHPALAPSLAGDDRAASDFERTVTDFLVAHGIVGVERDPRTDELTVIPDESTVRMIARHMKDHDVTRVQLSGGVLVMD